MLTCAGAKEPVMPDTSWMSRTVESVMSGSPVTVSDDEPLAAVADLLAGFEISGVPVVDASDRLIGVISQTDLVRLRGSRLSSSGWRGVLVRDLMSTPAKTISATALLTDAARLMSAERIHRLVVVDGRQTPIGVISESDIVREIAEYFDDG
jgi:CBS domain-containing protein